MKRRHIGGAVDRLEIVRIRPYTHGSRVAGCFANGRVALIGGTAHVTPP
ncbi:hypothetical protein [Thauera sp. Sel9]|nr:hypothetical protein [Thauera sp. Sel9]MCV2217893.1 hypothetical protein [Thauera sp. Sel9]